MLVNLEDVGNSSDEFVHVCNGNSFVSPTIP